MPADGDAAAPAISRRKALGRRYFDRRVRLSVEPGDGSLPRDEANKDEQVRRWDPVAPSATLIGRPEGPDADLDETVRRLHDERHPAMAGHSERMHRLDKARIAHALCNALELTAWERDRVLGIVTDLDLTAFGSQRGVARVSLVVIQHVVDAERRRQLGLHDREWLQGLPPERFEELYDQFTSIKDDERYRELLDRHGLDTTSVNRLGRVLEEQLEAQDLDGAVLGRNPHQDPSLPSIGHRGGDAGPEAAGSDD